MAVLIKQDGSSETVKPANQATGFTLDEVYTLIGNGCDIVQMIQLPTGNNMLIDEEAKIRVRPEPMMVNKKATVLLHQAGGMPDDEIIGNVLIVTRKEFQ
jgi:hypothetical protein